MILSPTVALGKDLVYPASVLINCAFLVFALLAFWRYCRDELGERVAGIGVLLLSLNPCVWVNGATGLETNLILWITVGAWTSVEGVVKKNQGDFFHLSVFCVLSIFSRVDGFILPSICFVYLLIKGERRSAIRLMVILAIVMIAYTAFRLIYYNDFIANTFYNKISGDLLYRLWKGVKFFKFHSLRTGIWLAMPLAVLILLGKGIAGQFLDRLNFPIVFFAAWSAYLIYIGGDVYYERFVVAMIPMGIYIVLYASSRLNRFALYSAVFLLLITPFLFVPVDGRFEYSIGKYDFWIETGKFLEKNYRSETLAVDASGKIPFFSDLYTIDMLGLNDKHIAKMKVQAKGLPGHTKFDPHYVISRKPTLIAAWIKSSFDMEWGLRKELYSANYQLKYLINPSRVDMGERNIREVSSLSDSEIAEIIDGGQNYGILIRRDVEEK